MDLYPWPKKRRSKNTAPDNLEPFQPRLPENQNWPHHLEAHSQDLLCTHDLKGRILSANAAAARVLGSSVEEMMRLSIREVIAPEFRSEVDAYLKQIESAGAAHGLMRVITRGGERRILEYHCALRAEEGESPMAHCIGHDVTEQKQTEKQLREVSESLLDKVRESERTIRDLKLFRTLVDQGNDAIEVVDPDTLRFLDVNEKECAELGYSREELLSMKVLDIDPSVTEASAAKIVEELRKSGSLVFESHHRRKDGITFPVELSMRWVQLDRDYIIAISRDLTERKLAEARLRASQERYRAVHDRSPAGICWVETGTGRFIGVNSKFCEIAGRTEEDLLSRTFQTITHPDDLAENHAKLRDLAEGKVRHYEMEKRYVRPDGSIRWVEVAIVAMGAEGGPPTWHMAIVQDISERKQAEERLREYKRVVEGLDEMIVVVDRDYRYAIANRAYLNYRGIESVQAVGWRVDEVINKAVFEETVKPRMDDCFQGKIVRYEMKYEFPRAGERDLLVSYVPIEGPTGVDRIACILQDVTERKRIEGALRESERVQKLILDHLPVGVLLSSLGEERTIYQNPRFFELFGYSMEQFPTVAEWWPLAYPDPDYRERVSSEWKRRMAEAARTQGEIEPMEVTITCHDKSRKHVRVLASVIGNRNFITFIDLTERKQVEEALEKSREKFSKAFRLSPMSITLTSMRDHRYIEVNETFERMTGWRREEVLGRTPFDIDLWVNPEDRKRLAQRLLTEGSLRNVEASFRRRDGAIRVGFGTADLIEVNGEPCAISVAADITERKRSEQALLEAKEFSENLIRTANVMILGLDPEGSVRLFNRAAEEITGYKFSELEGRNWSILVPRDSFPGAWEEFERLMAGTAGQTYENPIITKKGEKRYIAWRNSQVRVNGKIVATISFGNDITERKQTEEALRQSEERLRVALSGSPIKVFNQDRDLRYTWVYNLQEGWTEKDYLGKTDEEIFGPEIAATMSAIKRPVLETGQRVRQECSFNERGKTYHCDITVEPLLNAAGDVVGVNCACVDITQMRDVTEELRLAKEKLSEEKLYLEQAIDSELGFGEIIGRSSALKDVMEKVAKVAPSNATVLLQGETGTGKELVARALHRLSRRSTKTFIKLNCAAIPSGLLESELFGHEKGAFTGAVARKIGRLELADQGTLFLDEVGEIPLSLQPKLLRVLQDQEFERLGSTQTLKVNFRLLAATNRNLLQSVKEGDFRSDLFYRLNVFPIVIPPLRDRREDVRILVEHFVRHYASRMNKVITSLPSKTMEALVQWEWPGNIRELENFVERSVILTSGSVLQVPLGELRSGGRESNTTTLRDLERERILRALRECHGQLGGPNGAAARLGLKRTTLQSRLNQLGIKPDQYRK